LPQFAELASMQQACCVVQPTQAQRTPPSPFPPEPLSKPPEELLEAPLEDDEAPLEEEDTPLDEVEPPLDDEDAPLDDPLEELAPPLELELDPDLHASRHSSAMHPSSESPSPFSLAA
jgi:hypothetical protein